MESSTSAQRPGSGGTAVPFLAVGILAIVIGGLFSAATARSATYHSAWSVAYIVLVVGVAQVALGVGQWWLAAHRIPVGILVGELLVFNLGNLGVVLGTVLAASIWVDVGSALLVVALATFGWKVWSPRRSGWVLLAYWALIVLLSASVIIGLIFAHLGAS